MSAMQRRRQRGGLVLVAAARELLDRHTGVLESAQPSPVFFKGRMPLGFPGR
jgi:hypothetical protein